MRRKVIAEDEGWLKRSRSCRRLEDRLSNHNPSPRRKKNTRKQKGTIKCNKEDITAGGTKYFTREDMGVKIYEEDVTVEG